MAEPCVTETINPDMTTPPDAVKIEQPKPTVEQLIAANLTQATAPDAGLVVRVAKAIFRAEYDIPEGQSEALVHYWTMAPDAGDQRECGHYQKLATAALAALGASHDRS